ncbi:hypothetical protein SeMB42_g05204 [Synchytrium endobioticum]|uniref:MAGE domain-containing protein n=1 Tax=Synchytrium endobioticum TaxID=286115 RepID=A0A507CSV0_9FUNG|nr:hypothetical protein SeLEV6574_g07945 [Synchytrium endobioticum]TPX42240.1 hypothetical protein SeMB42_g05208 [Synchytrium endobioticum]TPX42244.1 hypothetical protein SeMB42_g05206 [Synchytrium endobioticum]TPX42246.1 hypothetical protein SeMB42_g05204 [Synchytrium endobioticum]
MPTQPNNRRVPSTHQDDEENADDETPARRRPGTSRAPPSGRPRNDDSNDDDTHCDGKPSMLSQLLSSIPPAEMETYVSAAVKVALAACRRGKPFTKRDIVEHVLAHRGKAVSHVFDEMRVRLLDVFGFHVVELHPVERPRNLDAERRALAKSLAKASAHGVPRRTGQYMLVNALGAYHQRAALDEPDPRCRPDGLLVAILALIMVSGRTIDEKTLETHLRSLGVCAKRPHGEFGELAEVLKHFVNSRYLVKVTTPSADGDIAEYKWGARAIAEWPEKNMIMFISEIFNPSDDAAKRHLETVIKAAAEIEVPEGD